MSAPMPPAAKPYRQTIPGADAAFEMLPIPAGKFTMGGTEKDELPTRELKVEAFWMQKHEVTWDEYRLFMFANDTEKAAKDPIVDGVSRPTKPYVEMSFGMGLNGFPAISMTQHAANKYAQWLSAKTGHFYRLPTEAEWEYACRAGAPEPTALKDYAWFSSNTDGKYELVGKKLPNAWGLHDMLGNVMEWTLDGYAPYAPSQTSASEWAPSKGTYPQVARGGGWTDTAKKLRCAARTASDPSWKMQDPQIPKSIWYMTDAQSLGFRLVRPVNVPSVTLMHRAWNNGVEVE
ncbi:MAG: formylglycine-generating enzyme family protein [Bryobacteraceae bacterium]|nr:formylglycine-generating enzyme family protein [Bryobacteraceae bacterium]